jgi:outer membrane immunogenic protein
LALKFDLRTEALLVVAGLEYLMRRHLGWAFVSVISLGGFGGAMAADMAVKAPPPAVAVGYNWTGCYIGGDVGGGSAHQKASEYTIPAGFDAGPTAVSGTTTSVMGGVYAGCNYQFASRWVAGVEGDWSASSFSSTLLAPNTFANGVPTGSGGVTYSQSLKWIASARARLGYAVAPTVLLFVTGGGAWTNSALSGVHAYNNGCPNCSVTGNFSSTGWVAGGGIDWAPWSNNWIVRAEGLYYDLYGSAVGFQQGTTTPATTSWTNRTTIVEGRVGISYKFGGPIVAKY